MDSTDFARYLNDLPKHDLARLAHEVRRWEIDGTPKEYTLFFQLAQTYYGNIQANLRLLFASQAIYNEITSRWLSLVFLDLTA
jgi:hypothetical protein